MLTCFSVLTSLLFFLQNRLFCEVAVVQSISCVLLFVSPWTAACQAPLSSSVSQNLLRLMSIGSMMPSTHLILSHPLLLPPSIFPSITVFSSEWVLHIRRPEDWSFRFSSDFAAKKIKSVSAFTVSPSLCHEVMGLDAMILVFWMLNFKPTFSPSSFYI